MPTHSTSARCHRWTRADARQIDPSLLMACHSSPVTRRTCAPACPIRALARPSPPPSMPHRATMAARAPHAPGSSGTGSMLAIGLLDANNTGSAPAMASSSAGPGFAPFIPRCSTAFKRSRAPRLTRDSWQCKASPAAVTTQVSASASVIGSTRCDVPSLGPASRSSRSAQTHGEAATRSTDRSLDQGSPVETGPPHRACAAALCIAMSPRERPSQVNRLALRRVRKASYRGPGTLLAHSTTGRRRY